MPVGVAYEVVEHAHLLEHHSEFGDLLRIERVLPAHFVPLVEDFAGALVAVNKDLEQLVHKWSWAAIERYLITALLGLVISSSPAAPAVEERGRTELDDTRLWDNIQLNTEGSFTYSCR